MFSSPDSNNPILRDNHNRNKLFRLPQLLGSRLGLDSGCGCSHGNDYTMSLNRNLVPLKAEN